MPNRASTRPSPRERFQYWFDSIMARGTIAVMGLLGIATVVFIAFVALLVMVLGFFPPTADGEEAPSFFELLWGNLMRTLDPGTMGGDLGWGFRAAMLVVTIGGLIMVASLIGIISGAFDSKVEELRKGRSRVLESNHTLILGWSSKVLPIISELCIANESRKRPVIVVLADRGKVEMEDELKAQLPRRTRTRIIVRRGDPMDLGDLELGNPHTARSIILLAPENQEDPDSIVIKMALALTNNPRRGEQTLDIVGELQDARNLEAATLVGRNEVSWILTRDLISRITVQTCRQSGLSGVYTDLLDFAGDELYFHREPALVGKTFFEAQLSFASSCVMGIMTGDTVKMNPDPATIITAEDQLIHIAADDSVIRLATAGVPDSSVVSESSEESHQPERTLVLGYNNDLRTIMRELDAYVAPGSATTVVADVEPFEFLERKNMTVEFVRGDTTSRAVLESLEVPSFDHIIVLAYRGLGDNQRADAKTLVTLLHLREIGNRAGTTLNIVSEMLDDRNREIAEVTKADDFIVSDKIISLALSQLSENRQLSRVFDTLFDSDASEIYLKPAGRYIRPNITVDFYSVLAAARQRGETAIGYRIAEHSFDSSQNYGVRLNPLKTERIALAPADRVIVLAED